MVTQDNGDVGCGVAANDNRGIKGDFFRANIANYADQRAFYNNGKGKNKIRTIRSLFGTGNR
jgi:hypothetical protein